MAEIDLFPKARSVVITIRRALHLCEAVTFTGRKVEKNKAYRSAITRKLWSDCFDTVSNGNNRLGIHPSETRYFSIEEIKRACSFPGVYTITGTAYKKEGVLGNSVPPLFMQAIAANIRYLAFDGKAPWQPDDDMGYKAILDEAWQQHLAPKDETAPAVISTFAGGGGSSLGYSMAGYKELLAVEWDDNAVATFKANFPGVQVYHGDIAKLSVERCMELAGLSEPGELDLLDGSPPCQGFSTAGKRNLNDDRNQLFREYVRLLRGLKPKVFVMENVSGLVKGKMKLVFAEIMKELKASGYKVRCKLLNAMYFHVPQSRQRLIFIGVRDDLEAEVSYPKAESRPICAPCAIGNIETSKNKYGHRNFNQSERYLTHHKPAYTVTKSEVVGNDLPFCDKDFRIDDIGCAVICSYPCDFRFVGDWKNAVARMANSVPPLFMRAIARHIRSEILSNV